MKNQLNRRIFIEKSAMGVAGAGMTAVAAGCTSSSASELGQLFVHHVFFWFKEPVTPEGRTKFENALKELITVETIVDSHLGIPASTNREVIDSSYTYSLLLTFRNKEEQDIYQTHSKHLKFIAECQDLWERVLVYDSVEIN